MNYTQTLFLKIPSISTSKAFSLLVYRAKIIKVSVGGHFDPIFVSHVA